MSWLLPFLRPLVPVAVDYARARIQISQQQPQAPDVSDVSVEPIAARLADAEARADALAIACNDLGAEIARLSAEANARIQSARKWGLVLLAWNVALTIAVIVALIR